MLVTRIAFITSVKHPPLAGE